MACDGRKWGRAHEGMCTSAFEGGGHGCAWVVRACVVFVIVLREGGGTGLSLSDIRHRKTRRKKKHTSFEGGGHGRGCGCARACDGVSGAGHGQGVRGCVHVGIRGQRAWACVRVVVVVLREGWRGCHRQT